MSAFPGLGSIGSSRAAPLQWCYFPPPEQRHLNLTPSRTAGFIMANGSFSSNQSGEGDIRKNIIEAGLVDGIVALPGQLTQYVYICCLDGQGLRRIKKDES